jgi:tRNA pseudouridine55 synthase
MNGFLNLNKDFGWTSHDCVAKVRRILQTKKVGHGGTLDPAATGVLPIAVEKATRLLQFLPENKAYRARIRFGVRTTTDDLEGEVINAVECPDLSLQVINEVIVQFEGNIKQIPPAYSAISVGGKRLYELARAGKEVNVPVREVEVSKIEILNWYSGSYPELDLAIDCGPGTYIRAIARDLGDTLKVGGTLVSLERTLSCGFDLTESISLVDLEQRVKQGIFDLIPMEKALKKLPLITLSENEAWRWSQGQKIVISNNNLTLTNWRIFNDKNQFLGISEIVNYDNQQFLKPKIVLI